jgi:hypothetical protein
MWNDWPVTGRIGALARRQQRKVLARRDLNRVGGNGWYLKCGDRECTTCRELPR